MHLLHAEKLLERSTDAEIDGDLSSSVSKASCLSSQSPLCDFLTAFVLQFKNFKNFNVFLHKSTTSTGRLESAATCYLHKSSLFGEIGYL